MVAERSEDEALSNSNSSSEDWKGSAQWYEYRKTWTITTIVALVVAVLSAGIVLKVQLDNASSLAVARTDVSQAYEEARQASNAVQAAEDNSIYSSTTNSESARKRLDEAYIRNTAAQEVLKQAQAAASEADARSDGTVAIWLLYLAALVAGMIIVLGIRSYVRAEKLREWENRQVVDRLGPTSGSGEDELELRRLWAENRMQLQHYHQLVLNYAASTRQTTQVTLLISFAFLLIISIFALFARDLPSAVASSVVAAAGSVVTGFVVRGILRNADASSRELLSFFSHPIDVERALAAERLISRMPTEQQGEATLAVVRYLAGPRVAHEATSQALDIASDDESVS